MGRVNETQTHGDAPKFPFPPLPGPGGWWPGTVSVIRAASLRYFDVRSRKWSMRKGSKTRFVARREGPHPPLPWWTENAIFCEILWVKRPAEGASALSREIASSRSVRIEARLRIGKIIDINNLRKIIEGLSLLQILTYRPPLFSGKHAQMKMKKLRLSSFSCIIQMLRYEKVQILFYWCDI